ncbi:MAG: hypothetical protein CM15mP74_22640 [Halieaceae bacterium]|nr:MAG: hypothetical protein CM15mP74_22640 [Halieaceae bacterium]
MCAANDSKMNWTISRVRRSRFSNSLKRSFGMVTNEQLHQDALGRFEEYRQAEALGAVKRGEDARDLART